MSGADLHAWPAVVLLLMLAPTVRGQQADSTDTAEEIPNPGTALLAGLIPGGGQVYNGKWLKAAFFVGAEAYYISRWQESADFYVNYDTYEPETLPLSRNKYLENRNKFAWWIAAYYIMGMLDAYVDAHLATFPADTAGVRPEILPAQTEESP